MDLKNTLALEKSEQSGLACNSIEIAEQNKPYSPIEVEDTNSIEREPSNKTVTNWQQIENKLIAKPTTNQKQIENRKNLIGQNQQQSGSQTSNVIDNKMVINQQQTENKVATKSSFSELVGLQREIVIFICYECKNSRSKITEALTLEYLAKALKRGNNTVKTTIQRLEKKGCLTRVKSKKGRGGWSRYEVPDHIYHDTLRNETDNKLLTNWKQTDDKVALQSTAESATSSFSSSNNLINKTTTELSEKWDFDISLYSKFGFTRSQLKQLASLGVISAADVEQSLIEFNFDLENNSLPSIRGGKTNFLMGLFRKGVKYTSEVYLNEQEAAISEMARRIKIKQKKQLEDRFLVWKENLDENQRKQIETNLPTSLIASYRAQGIEYPEVTEWLFNYFIQNFA